jgi:hypothetical protein
VTRPRAGKGWNLNVNGGKWYVIYPGKVEAKTS